jgi:hypothetical protein
MIDTLIDMPSHATRFAWVVSGRARGSSDLFDVPMYADSASVVLPSVGSLVPGWSLVVPKYAARNLTSLSLEQRQALRPARDFANALSSRFAGEVFEFEHGPAAVGSLTGCGVDHAHLHVAALPFDLVQAVGEAHGGHPIEAETLDPWATIAEGRDYWLVRRARTGEGLLVYPETPVSQGIRRIVAASLGLRSWDYRAFPFADHAAHTRRAAEQAG